MSGIAAVVELRKAGYTDLTVYEKADRVGGTWRENTYPGLSCDIPSRWYSFRFALNPDWSHRFSYGPEIQAYMEGVARDFDVESIVRFNAPVKKLDYEAPSWRLVTEDGEESVYDVVIGATGILHKPVHPDIEGLDSFGGACFHSARWDHSVDLAGNLSLITISEHQIDFVISMLDKMKRDGHVAIAAKEESYSAYNDAMNEALPNTVWITGGCTSWYMDKSGLPNLYPWAPERYLKDMRRPVFSEFHLLDRVEAVTSS